MTGSVGLSPSEGFQHRHRHGDVGNVAWCQRDGDDPATTIGQTMDLRCSAAARDTDRLAELPPFPPDAERCAFTLELSSASSSGIGPAAAILAKMRCPAAGRRSPMHPTPDIP